MLSLVWLVQVEAEGEPPCARVGTGPAATEPAAAAAGRRAAGKSSPPNCRAPRAPRAKRVRLSPVSATVEDG